MEDQKQLPRVLLLRVQNKLRKPVRAAYPSGHDNIVKAHLEDGAVIFFNLVTNTEVPAAQLKVRVEDQPVKVLKDKNDPGAYDKAISRSSFTPDDPELAPFRVEEEKPVKKKSVTKKATAKKTLKSKSTK